MSALLGDVRKQFCSEERTKKDFYDCARGKVDVMANTTGIESKAKVFWFFSSGKNCFFKLLCLQTNFSTDS
jgi:hypothetical protein